MQGSARVEAGTTLLGYGGVAFPIQNFCQQTTYSDIAVGISF